MSPRKLTVTLTVTLTAAILVALIFWRSWPGDAPVGESAVARPEIAPVPENPGPSPGEEASDLPAFGTPEFGALVRERSAAWLAGRHRDAGSLLALWDLTGDASLLEEAAQNFPDNPQLCLAMVTRQWPENTPASEKSKWVENLIAADPDNPLGYFYRAKLAMPDAEAVIAAVREGMERPGRVDGYFRNRVLTVKEGMLASGATLTDSARLSLLGPLSQGAGNSVGHIGLFKAFKTEMNSLTAAGHGEQQQELAALGLGVIERLALSEAPTMTTDLVVNSGRRFFLGALDAETELVNTGRTAGEELTLQETEKQHLLAVLNAQNETTAWLRTAPAEMTIRYADLFVLKGEAAARGWLTSEYEKAGGPQEGPRADPE